MSEPPGPVVRVEEIAFVDDGEDRVAMVRLRDLAAPPVVLTGTAAAIWRAVDGERDIPGITTEVAPLYGVDPAEIVDQVAAFVEDMRVNGLVEPAGTPPPTPGAASAH